MIDLSKFDNSGFDRGAPRWKEVLWSVFRAVLFMHSLPVPSPVKAAALRAFGAEVGRGVVIRGRVNVSFPWRLSIADHVWIGDDVTFLTLAPIAIGPNVCLSQKVFLCTGSHDFESVGFDLVTNPITIGRSCWIAASAFISPGVTIGQGSLVAAGAVVTRDVAGGIRVGGNPARPI